MLVCVHNGRSNTSAAAEVTEFRKITTFQGKTQYLMKTLYICTNIHICMCLPPSSLSLRADGSICGALGAGAAFGALIMGQYNQ